MSQNIIFQRRCKELLSLGTALAAYCVLSILFHIPCPIKWVTGISCPGCGMTRSLISLCKLDISAAIAYHPLIFYIVIAAPLLVVLYLKGADKARKIVIAISAVLLIGVYLYRMIFAHAPVLEFDPANGMIPKFYRWLGSLLG